MTRKALIRLGSDDKTRLNIVIRTAKDPIDLEGAIIAMMRWGLHSYDKFSEIYRQERVATLQKSLSELGNDK